MSDDYLVREATEDDIPALVRSRVRMFEDMAVHRGDPIDRELMAWIGRESTAVFEAGFGGEHVGWVAERDGAAVASAMVTIQPWLPHPRYPSGNRPYFHSVHTVPEHRGHGLARRLTEVAIDWARARGFVTFALHASEQGRPIYERLGFVPASEYVLPLTYR
ncbi:MAG: GNAT family N-acetyltransferase [Ilumatobacteraceae bacterium]|nr:GNAT family N-acetyltransferase [Ilumatobacteraceae bacterium]